MSTSVGVIVGIAVTIVIGIKDIGFLEKTLLWYIDHTWIACFNQIINKER